MQTSVPRQLNFYVASLVLATALAVVTPLLASESVNFPSALRQAGSAVQLSGYLYRPDGPGPFPAVVMLHGCSGLMTRSGKIAANARFWAEHLRDHGYVALLVDSFTARGIDEVCTGRHNLSAVRDRADDARPYAPLLVLIGAKDDWTPAAPCVHWTERAQALGAPMRLKVYPDAHHGFDAPNNPVHVRPEVRNRNKPGGCCGATIGTEPAARADAICEVTQFFASELGGRGISP